MKPISLPKKIVYALVLIFLNVWFYTQNVPFHTAAAWISYLFAHIAFLAMVFAPLLTTPGIRAEDSRFNLQMIAVIYFLAEVLAVWVFSEVLPFGWRLALVLQLAALIVFVVLVFGSAAADRDTEQAARRKKAEVGRLRECCAVLEDVMPQMNDPAQRRQVKLLYDQLHASPTRSVPEVQELEQSILEGLEQLQELQQDASAFDAKVQSLQAQVVKRNQILKYKQ